MRVDALEICLASLLGWKAAARLQALRVMITNMFNRHMKFRRT